MHFINGFVVATSSIWENLVRGLQNTVMGMGTVFVVLIFIACIISLLQFIPKLFSKPEKTVAPVVETTPAVAPVEEVEELVDDKELVAVITAAICAASNQTSADQLIVRSIKRAKEYS